MTGDRQPLFFDRRSQIAAGSNRIDDTAGMLKIAQLWHIREDSEFTWPKLALL
jgi:hypothetical protein